MADLMQACYLYIIVIQTVKPDSSLVFEAYVYIYFITLTSHKFGLGYPCDIICQN